jgi:putative ATP-dependent endonuclease of OLD family
MLIYAMMKKTDEHIMQSSGADKYEPLLSQNVSVIEVGAYSHIFATFLGFLGIKTLIITDLDCAKLVDKGKYKKCSFSEGTNTTNASIKHFTGLSELSDIVSLAASPITLSYDNNTASWNLEEKGRLRLLFQKEENGYQARSFEDSFICNNLQFIIDHKNDFKSLKNKSVFDNSPPDFYDIAERCIDSKTSFALDVLLYGGKENKKWTTPLYIKEGLEWLAK